MLYLCYWLRELGLWTLVFDDKAAKSYSSKVSPIIVSLSLQSSFTQLGVQIVI